MSKNKLKIGDMMKASATVSAPVITPVTPSVTPEVSPVTPSVTPEVIVNPVITPVSTSVSTPSGELELLKAQLASQAIALAALQANKSKGYTKTGLAGFEACYEILVKKMGNNGVLPLIDKAEYQKIADACKEKTGRTYISASAKIDTKYFIASLLAIKSKFELVAKGSEEKIG